MPFPFWGNHRREFEIVSTEKMIQYTENGVKENMSEKEYYGSIIPYDY